VGSEPSLFGSGTRVFGIWYLDTGTFFMVRVRICKDSHLFEWLDPERVNPGDLDPNEIFVKGLYPDPPEILV
jgi:hypothetical protein